MVSSLPWASGSDVALLNDSLDSVMFSESKYWDAVRNLSAYVLPELTYMKLETIISFRMP